MTTIQTKPGEPPRQQEEYKNIPAKQAESAFDDRDRSAQKLYFQLKKKAFCSLL